MADSPRRRYSRSRSPYSRGHPKARSRSRSPSRSQSRLPVPDPRTQAREEEAVNRGNNLYVTGLSSRVTERDIKDYLSKERRSHKKLWDPNITEIFCVCCVETMKSNEMKEATELNAEQLDMISEEMTGRSSSSFTRSQLKNKLKKLRMFYETYLESQQPLCDKYWKNKTKKQRHVELKLIRDGYPPPHLKLLEKMFSSTSSMIRSPLEETLCQQHELLEAQLSTVNEKFKNGGAGCTDCEEKEAEINGLKKELNIANKRRKVAEKEVEDLKTRLAEALDEVKIKQRQDSGQCSPVMAAVSTPDSELRKVSEHVKQPDQEEKQPEEGDRHTNGIPNSTRKYQEDQRVIWHSTPFSVLVDRCMKKTS